MTDLKHTKDKEVHHMAVSMAVVPLLKGEVAKSFMEGLDKTRIRPYTDEERKATDEKVAEIIKKRNLK